MDKTIAIIKKEGDQWVIYSKTGKKLSSHPSEKEAKERLRQIEYFKHQKGSIATEWLFTLIDIPSI